MPIIFGTTASGGDKYFTPQPPTIGTATDVGTSRAYNNGAATVTFTPSTSGGTATSFTATSTPGSFTGSASSSPVTVAGLQSATSYTFAVTATDAQGTSSASSASNSITATTVPQAPTIGSAFGGTAGVVSVTFTANATGGSAITGYTVTSSSGVTATGSSSPITVNETVGGSYTYTVVATNANGNSTASSASNSVTSTFPSALIIGANDSFISSIYTTSNGNTLYLAGAGDGLGGVGFASIGSSGTFNGGTYSNTVTKGGNNVPDRAIGTDSSGNVYYLGNQYTIAPSTGETYLIARNSSGTLLWQNKIVNAQYGTGKELNVFSATVDSSGNTYLVGSRTTDTYGTYNSYIMKVNSSGSQVFSYNTPRGWGDIKVAPSGNIYVTDGNWIAKYNSSYTLQWLKGTAVSFNSTGTYNSFVIDSNEDLYFATHSTSSTYAGVFKINSSDGSGAWATKFTYTGGHTGKNFYYFSTAKIAIDPNNNVYYAGMSTDMSIGGAIVKLNSSGAVAWTRNLRYYVNNGGLYHYGVSADSSYFYSLYQTNAGTPTYVNGTSVFKLPVDGSKTGTYDPFTGGFNHIYESGVISTASTTIGTSNNTFGTPISAAAPYVSTSSLTFASTSTTIFGSVTPRIVTI